MVSRYTSTAVEQFLHRYSEYEGAQLVQTEEGVLGWGNWICTAPSKKTAIITEVFQNEWSSLHKIRMYNKTPKKYLKQIEQYENS